jgi:hypothetical protein
MLATLAALPAAYALRGGDDGWIPLFDGRSLDGWKANENQATFKVADGAIVAQGPRSHLFYSGAVRNAEFRNFELKVEAMARPGSNSGVYFHTRFQPQGWPEKGFEVQICNTVLGETGYRERKKTGSLYAVRNVYKQLARDDEWFELHVIVRGKRVEIRLNGTLIVDYIEPQPPVTPPGMSGRVLGSGTFALQGHDPDSRVAFRNIRVKPLPDDLTDGVSDPPVVDDVYRELLRLNAENYPVVDYHAHLKGGLRVEDLLAEARRNGIQYGIAVNGGLGFPVTDDAGAEAFLAELEGQPVFTALQGEGREWVTLFSPRTIAKFDYVFTDAMTFTDDSGKRLRLWIQEEVGEIPDAEKFMDMYVDRIVGVLTNEPIDIHANPTFLPDVIAADYDRLWTPSRMQKVIAAAKQNDVAIEINSRFRIPSATFIKAAKQAGVKFSFGTNNEGRELGRLEYCLQMVKECGLTWDDFFVPRPDGQKPVQKRGLW